MDPFVAPPGARLNRRVADYLGEAIVGGEFQPGTTLPTEPRLCEKYGVSRTVLREAIRSLIAKGLVDTRPKVGTRVRPPTQWGHLDPEVMKWHLAVTDTESYLKKMFELRLSTEPMACELSAKHATITDRDNISTCFLDMVAAGDDNRLWVEADLAFHKAIYFATGNEFFWPLGELLEVSLAPMFSIAARGSHRPRALEEHRALRDAILNGEPDRARETSLLLLENAANDIKRIRSAE